MQGASSETPCFLFRRKTGRRYRSGATWGCLSGSSLNPLRPRKPPFRPGNAVLGPASHKIPPFWPGNAHLGPASARNPPFRLGNADLGPATHKKPPSWPGNDNFSPTKASFRHKFTIFSKESEKSAPRPLTGRAPFHSFAEIFEL